MLPWKLNSKLTEAFFFLTFLIIFFFIFLILYLVKRKWKEKKIKRKNKNKVFICYSKPISFIFNLYLRISKFLSNSIYLVSLYLIFFRFSLLLFTFAFLVSPFKRLSQDSRTKIFIK